MTEWFVSHPLAAGVLAAVLHVADFVLTLVGYSMYQRVSEHISYESYELNPFFRKTITERRWLSRRFMISLAGMFGITWLVVAFYGALPPDFGTVGVGVLLGALVFRGCSSSAATWPTSSYSGGCGFEGCRPRVERTSTSGHRCTWR